MIIKMNFAKIYRNDILIAQEVELADSFFRRFLGLMFRKSMPQSHGLLLSPCNAIHTFSMKFAIDALFLAQDGTILFIEHAMKPNKTGKAVKKAVSVLELNTGTAEDFGLQIGDVLTISKTD
jgi:uncharacterized protein